MCITIMNITNKYVVSGNIMGGLGNQLFQIFTIIAASLSSGKQFVFPYDEVTRVGLNRPTYWKTMLRELHKYTIVKIEDKFNFSYAPETPFVYSYATMNAVQNFIGNVYLTGYFQSYKYFDKFMPQILDLLKLSLPKQILAKLFFEQLIFNPVSMHFRVGDYVNHPNSHPILPKEYYINALSFIKQNATVTHVLMFYEKNDEEYLDPVFESLKQKFPDVVFMTPDKNIPDWSEMLLMSCCSHNIIANSTFSWWGAYLNETPNHIVCYPELWFGPAINAPSLDDLFPLAWNKTSIKN